MAPREPFDRGDETPGEDDREVTARATGRETDELLDEAGEKVVPKTNVGGAAPTPLGMDSGGDRPGSQDDLENMPEPEPPEEAELGAVHVRREEPGEE
jgi:hypothetical protein